MAHSTESAETAGGAENVARFFQVTTRKASTHTVFDNDSGVRCVRDELAAYGAAGANDFGWHVEHVGTAAQSTDQWRDGFSQSVLARSAVEAHRVATRWGVPFRFVNAVDLRAMRRGFTTHAEVERAWPSTGHWDPGPNFPIELWIEMAAAVPLLPRKDVLMNDCVAARVCPLDGGLQKLQADGGVFNDNCAHYHGSYLDDRYVAPADRNVARRFVDIVGDDASSDYVIVSEFGEVFLR